MHKVIIAIRRHFGDCSFLYKSTVVAARKRSTEISRTLQAQADDLQKLTIIKTWFMKDSYSAQNKDIQHK
ncbi:hypothetical protein T12_5515 [Trichinella patagoniensis]|uniref:Uncharacterized protein n=1 Tax=Trichinella patagoniensis TaxID=990121 RepID=A0A0V1A7Z3_9BILA|nr:hypothetical protein T12_5515 [Trichinella patagoniensis]